jgi:hypothetical protein
VHYRFWKPLPDGMESIEPLDEPTARAEASWRKMLITQPSYFENHLDMWKACHFHHLVAGDPSRGVTIGELMRIAVAFEGYVESRETPLIYLTDAEERPPRSAEVLRAADDEAWVPVRGSGGWKICKKNQNEGEDEDEDEMRMR